MGQGKDTTQRGVVDLSFRRTLSMPPSCNPPLTDSSAVISTPRVVSCGLGTLRCGHKQSGPRRKARTVRRSTSPACTTPCFKCNP